MTLLLAMLLLLVPVARAQQVEDAGSRPVQPVPGKVLVRAEPFADGIVRTDGWSSVRLTMANGGPATEAALSYAGRSAQGGEHLYRRTVELPRGARKEVTLDFSPGLGGASREVRVAVGRDELALPFTVQVLGEDDVAVGVIGLATYGVNAVHEAWAEGVPGDHARALADQPRKVRVGLVPVEAMPDASFGWQALDWVVWPQADPSRADARQVEALAHWVADGGHLLVTVTDRWRTVSDSALGEILPVELTGVRDTAGLAAFATALGARHAEGIAPVATATVREVPGRHVVPLAHLPDGAPIWVAGSYGLGTVHVLLADPGVGPLADRLDREALWRRLLFLPPVDASQAWLYTWPADAWEEEPYLYSGRGFYLANYAGLPGGDPVGQLLVDLDVVAPTIDDFYVQGESHFTVDSLWEGDPSFRWETRIRQYLQDIPGVAPLPLAWLIAFSALYLLVIGPVDYLVLRALRRQPWTWITFPLTIAVFSAAALVGTSMVKGNQAVLTRLEIVDVLPGTRDATGALWRGDTYLGVFATRKTRLTVEPGFPDGRAAPLKERGTMFEGAVVSREGADALAWRAETWTLAYARSSWIARREGGVRVEALPAGGWRVHNELGVDLVQARLYARGFALDLGALSAGAHADLDTAPAGPDLRALEQWVVREGYRPVRAHDLGADWAIDSAVEHPEAGRGHLDLFGHVALVGVSPKPFEPLDLSGLSPVTRAWVVYRAPVHLSRGAP